MGPVKATPVPDALFGDNVPPGGFSFSDDGVEPFNSIYYCCPCGCGERMSLPIATGDKRDRYWKWDGNREEPTLEPSIKRLNGCKYHGYLTRGVWTFTSDSGVQ
jgi:uncharacterized protein DUF6527